MLVRTVRATKIVLFSHSTRRSLDVFARAERRAKQGAGVREELPRVQQAVRFFDIYLFIMCEAQSTVCVRQPATF